VSQNKTNNLDKLSYVLNEISLTNKFYVATDQVKLQETIAQDQTPVATLVMCCDSRAHTTAFTANPENNFFIVRNIGNQYILNQGSIEFGVINLQTPLLIFLGHTQCGAIKSAMEDYSFQSSALIREIDHLTLSIRVNELQGDTNTRYHQAVQNNINKQVELASKDFHALINQEKLIIVGMLLDLDNTHGNGYGKISLINYMGETDPNILCNIPGINDFFID